MSPIVPLLCHPVPASLASTHQATLLALPTELRLVIYTYLGNGLSPDPPSIRFERAESGLLPDGLHSSSSDQKRSSFPARFAITAKPERVRVSWDKNCIKNPQAMG